MKVLVTGGAGFIGSHILTRLLADNYEVVCLDNFDPYYDPLTKRKNIEPFLSSSYFSLIEGDINDPSLLMSAMEGCDYVFHEAAQAGVRISVEDPMKPHMVNASGTLAVLEAAVKCGVKKVVNASSSSVYGTVRYLPFDEDHPTIPVSPYGVSKLAAEHYCRVFSELYGLNTISLRYFTVYGPRMRPDLAISIFTRAALDNKPIQIFGDGTKTRDFTYIDDVVDANIRAIKKGSGVYNIGGGHHISILDLAHEIINVNDSSSAIEYYPPVKGDAEHTYAETKKAQCELGWKANTSIYDGLKKYASWVRE
ncbi:SDR family oxidoreductase [Methanospirillum sp. J.3.6.1-F.2.7.3]|uniref:SDR family oxidoreductase n=1 Tax=Methanospirillum purgamenti TaxID=2834276 RepID=A0A8E7B2L2_9EURY|nr:MULTISPECIES: SDR family oxidoreductase [Methanospirillum]MDX8549507.1 SDR family oxidoreductase [Methanospirillum hungatei]QVV89211.1 SDR family oxidoreductase [Methanospirillum sp. J.3.6.1-F.2.7.3]